MNEWNLTANHEKELCLFVISEDQTILYLYKRIKEFSADLYTYHHRHLFIFLANMCDSDHAFYQQCALLKSL